MFDVTIGDWDTDTSKLELYLDYKPFNCKYYQFHRIKEETFLKELKRSVKIRVPTPVQQSQYGTPILIIPKKEGTVRFITDYHRINQKLVRNPYPLHRIGKKMQHIVGFQYMTALDLNMR